MLAGRGLVARPPGEQPAEQRGVEDEGRGEDAVLAPLVGRAERFGWQDLGHQDGRKHPPGNQHDHDHDREEGGGPGAGRDAPRQARVGAL